MQGRSGVARCEHAGVENTQIVAMQKIPNDRRHEQLLDS